MIQEQILKTNPLSILTSQTLTTMINAMNIIASPLIKIDIEILNRKQYRHINQPYGQLMQ